MEVEGFFPVFFGVVLREVVDDRNTDFHFNQFLPIKEGWKRKLITSTEQVVCIFKGVFLSLRKVPSI